MKAKQTVCTALCALLALWSCNEDNGETPRSQNNELPENAIGFSVLQNIGGELPTKADITATNLDKMTVYAYYTGTNDFTPSSTPNLMSGVNVTKSSGTWTYSPLKYWPGDNQRVSFFAIAPEPVGNGIALKNSTGYPSFTITPPATPSSQKDIVVASAVNQTKGSGDGSVALNFNHAMAKVAFAASYTGSMPGDGFLKVTKLQLKDVAKSGTLGLTSSDFSWSDVSYDASNLANYTLSIADGDLINENLVNTSTTISTEDNMLKLVPQTAPNPKVQLTTTFSDGTISTEQEITANLASILWDAGKRITYSFEIDLPIRWDYAYNASSTVSSGATYTFTAPKDGNYKLETWGAGGSKGYAPTSDPGSGGYSKGIIYLKKNQVIYVYVGLYTTYGVGTGNTNTFNGGGRNSKGLDGYPARQAGIGGGATDFRLTSGTWNNTTSLNSRIMVAGGGGGGGSAGNGQAQNSTAKGDGGAGGGLTAGDGLSSTTSISNAKGGNQLSGGAKASLPTSDANNMGHQNGSLGTGGGMNWHGGGGGGGYYGGGAGGQSPWGEGKIVVGGGGGSSFISGMTGCATITSGTSSIVFTECSMIDGAGYEWNSGQKAITATSMPNPTGGTMTGNAGNGYARITFIGQ